MIVTNTMFQSVPWADALFAIDAPWWKHYGARVLQAFDGECYSGAKRPGFARKGDFPAFDNSGCGALALAAWKGAQRIVMVGYDCQKTGGMVHSHGDHPKGILGNAISMPQWPARFEACAAHLRRLRIDVVNATRATVLRCFPAGNLEDELR